MTIEIFDFAHSIYMDNRREVIQYSEQVTIVGHRILAERANTIKEYDRPKAPRRAAW